MGFVYEVSIPQSYNQPTFFFFFFFEALKKQVFGVTTCLTIF